MLTHARTILLLFSLRPNSEKFVILYLKQSFDDVVKDEKIELCFVFFFNLIWFLSNTMFIYPIFLELALFIYRHASLIREM